MTHTYNVLGMTCSSCVSKVKTLLASVPGVNNADVNLQKAEATIEMAKHVPVAALQEALKTQPQFKISEQHHAVVNADTDVSVLKIYKPILLVFAFILGVSLLAQVNAPQFSVQTWMNQFMAGFFLVFSFFKLLDLQGFADNYTTYDIVAGRWKIWAYVYPFVELALGIAYLTGFEPIVTNAVTFAVMSVSLVGVLKSLLKKRKIRCACLGAVFNLPMSTITVFEDVLMIVMSAVMLMIM